MDITVSAIEPTRLDALRRTGRDERGNPLTAFPAEGWEPLRCCLRLAAAGEAVALIAYTPFESGSPWAETGPVYVHHGPCAGYPTSGELPAQLRTGPRILRTYLADGSLDYDHITLVPADTDIEPSIRALLAVDAVATVHVRAVQSQCFAYAVTR